MWDNREDARMRSVESVVRYDNLPVYIRDIVDDPPGLKVQFTYLLKQKTELKDIKDELFDWSPVPTGNVNTEHGMLYLCRRPVRKWKQGLHRDNMRVVDTGQVKKMIMNGHLLRSREFGRTVMRDYPSYEEAFQHVSDGKDARGRVIDGRAFSPNFGLERTDLGLLWLCYRGERVGWYEKGRLRLGEGREYLIQSYEEVVA